MVFVNKPLRLLFLTLSLSMCTFSLPTYARGGGHGGHAGHASHSSGHSEGHSSESFHEESFENTSQISEKGVSSTHQETVVSHTYTGTHTYAYIPRPVEYHCDDWNSETGVCEDNDDTDFEVMVVVFIALGIIAFIIL